MSMTRYHVRITAPDYQALLAHLLGHPQTYEQGAFMLAGRIRLPETLTFVCGRCYLSLETKSSPTQLCTWMRGQNLSPGF